MYIMTGLSIHYDSKLKDIHILKIVLAADGMSVMEQTMAAQTISEFTIEIISGELLTATMALFIAELDTHAAMDGQP